MSDFPFVSPSSDTPEIDILSNDTSPDMDYSVDPLTNRIGTRKAEGLQVVVEWAERALKTARRRFAIYSWDYGQDIEDYIGSVFDNDLLDSEIKRTITEALLQHPSITGVVDFEYQFSGSHLQISCRIETIYGRGDVIV